MPLTKLENQLRLQARELIQQGHLPGVEPSQLWGGPGTGQRCSLCGDAINSNDFEYEIEQRANGDARTYRFHFMCHAAWQLECARKAHLDKQQTG